jgi:hypothetical protein
MNLKFPITPVTGLLLAALAITLLGGPSDDPQPLKMTAEILSQRYCSDNNKTFDIVFRIRLRIVNQSNKKLIIEKEPLSLYFHDFGIARNAKDLSAGRYEYHPNVDGAIERAPETSEQFKSPGSNFAIFAPGEAFQLDKDFGAESVGRQQETDSIPWTLPPGNHVLQISAATWDFETKPEQIRKQWESFGYLVYESISTGSLPFNLPADPKIEKCR